MVDKNMALELVKCKYIVYIDMLSIKNAKEANK